MFAAMFRIARQWFEKAVALGNPEAKQNLRWDAAMM